MLTESAHGGLFLALLLYTVSSTTLATGPPINPKLLGSVGYSEQAQVNEPDSNSTYEPTIICVDKDNDDAILVLKMVVPEKPPSARYKYFESINNLLDKFTLCQWLEGSVRGSKSTPYQGTSTYQTPRTEALRSF